ncbi:MAG: diaminopimelate dehydrogenase [Actinomycetaceae bacterium]|nr:diaminopimelate dehydrogenase [Actinomycetaceae bacterium]
MSKRSPIRIAINGYGNLGRAVEKAVHNSPDMELVAIFTRRDPATLATQHAPAVAIDEAKNYVDLVDVCVLCGGSATDLGTQTPDFTKLFHTVDSFDTHAKIPAHFAAVDAVARENSHVAVISSGWDPGLFSLNRLIGESILPRGETYTFWGRGVSQGHSDAIRRIDGVVGAVQYTVPVEEAKQRVLAGEAPELSTREKHRRECFVVVEENADQESIRDQIVNMENYFSDYDTTVTFISAEELSNNHAGMPHGGSVIRTGQTSEGVTQVYSFDLALDSNPEFTGAVLTATARAVSRMVAAGQTGAYTVFDIPPAYYSPVSAEELRAQLL